MQKQKKRKNVFNQMKCIYLYASICAIDKTVIIIQYNKISITTLKIYYAVELACSKITQILSNTKLPHPNLSLEEKKALQKLQSNQSIRIMKVNKGNCKVLMDKKDYDANMHLLKDLKVYQILPVGHKSTEITEKEVKELVYGFAKGNKIKTSVSHQLKCNKAVTLKFYDLPKIHKSDVPLRPVLRNLF